MLEEAVRAAGFKVSKKTPVQSYIWQLPAHIDGPYAERDPIATLALFENLNPILDQEGTRAAYRLDVVCCQWSTKCVGAAFASIRVRPSKRVTIACRNVTLRSPSCRSSSAARQHGRDRVAKMEGANLRHPSHQLSAHGERQSIIQGWQNRLDGCASALVTASDRDRQQVPTRRKHISRRPHLKPPDR